MALPLLQAPSEERVPSRCICRRICVGAGPVQSSRYDVSFECGERRPSQVDPRLLGSDTDRLLAGVARLIYRHVLEGEASGTESAEQKPASQTSRRPGSTALTAADFDEELFAEPRRCMSGRCSWSFWRSFLAFRRPALVEEIYSLLKSISELSDFKKEMVVLAAIYVERLLSRHPSLHLEKSNWRPLLIAALHLASKTWEDVHAWNAEFSVYLRVALGLRYPARKLHRLELQVLTGLEFRMEVCGEQYASYYFALMEANSPPTPPQSVQDSMAVSDSLGPRSVSCSIEAGRCVLERDKLHTDSDCPPTPSSASSAGKVVLSAGRPTIVESWMSVTTCATSTHAGLHRPASSSACCQAASSALHATFCGASQEDSLWQLRPTLMPRLEPLNPYVGYFRHAPRAMPPSPHISRRVKVPGHVDARGRTYWRAIHAKNPTSRRLASL